MPDCLFCQIVAGKIPANVVYEDEYLLAFHDIAPKADTHLLVIPKRHIVNLNDLSDADASLMSHLMLSLPAIARTQNLTGFRTITNTGKEGGQEVFHMHFHILGGDQLPGF
ncbi:histidine triad nucleotide-binding protein [Thalassolituus hydrocarboniclasticus]|uniref:Histidine triad nucleotide-binding protein n=1 Tax=Thalassolituus hydrocarboniclasticus TaxID=2742796 RepID=A0ABY6A5V6_9GAMM|nr:histidine triad nucleotide-binding protein [Thalassolituus hydrocarboniclasticus]UXD86112.1 histidine triad nucleotide-binding protein [Thalassolituus hydrocarboniclasticus]